MKKIFFVLSLFASLVLVGCGTSNPNVNCTTGNVCTLPTTSGQQLQQTSLTGVAQQTIHAIKTQDFATLATLASANGVRFSAYEHVNTTTDVVLSTQQIANALSISAAYNRGTHDGSGEPINLGIGQYRTAFVYDVDFAAAPIQQRNQIIQRGNIINNIATIYAGKQVVEYHFNGFDPQYDGMDRKSLWLVFGQENNERKLIGVIHGQRTT